MTPITNKEQRALDVLRRAVAEALDRKRRLGQYAVIWRDGKPMKLLPETPERVVPLREDEAGA